MKKINYRLKFSSRIISITLLVSVLSSVIISAVSVLYLQRHLMNESRSHIQSLAQIAARTIDGDLLEDIMPGDHSSYAFRTVFRQLYHFTADDEVVFIYTMRKAGDEVQYVVDATYDIPSPAGEPFPTYEEIERAFAGEVTLDSKVTSDEWGNYYSAFAPVYNSPGEIVGIVGIDCSVDRIQQKTRVLVNSLVFIELICTAAMASLSMIAAHLMGLYLKEASKDGLTGVYNRRYAMRFVAENLRKKKKYAYLIMDIDRFKAVNDTYGHRTGDRTLQALAKILEKNASASDIVFRLGGDEFGMFLPREMTEEQLENMAEKIRRQFAMAAEVLSPNISGVGLSLGGIVGEEQASFGDMYHGADALLYQVKNSGKGSCLVGKLKLSEDRPPDLSQR